MNAAVKPVKELNRDQIVPMMQLMQSTYLNVTEEQFMKDLQEKDSVILLYVDGNLCGFSTWVTFEHYLNERHVNVIFSGDTVIDKSHWGSIALPMAWGKLMLKELDDNPDKDLYWFLTSKGYKTYRFLPVFFKEFCPSYNMAVSEFDKLLLLSLAKHKFGDRFDPETYIIKADGKSQCLRPGIADLSSQRLKDEHIRYFYQRNPNYAQGDELACLVRCHLNNIRPFILHRLLK
jgi:hypothetical protein